MRVGDRSTMVRTDTVRTKVRDADVECCMSYMNVILVIPNFLSFLIVLMVIIHHPLLGESALKIANTPLSPQ